MLKHPLSRLRFIGILEGISYLLLLGVAMPLKYFADLPLAVTIVGSLHGLLFILFLLALIQVKFSQKWPWKRMLIGFIASIIPIGNFIFDISLKKEEKKLMQTSI